MTLLVGGSYVGDISCNEPKPPVPFAKHRQVFEGTVFHIHSVFVIKRVSFILDKTRYSMTSCLVQHAHGFDLERYFLFRFIILPLTSRVCLLFDHHFLTQSSVSLQLISESEYLPSLSARHDLASPRDLLYSFGVSMSHLGYKLCRVTRLRSCLLPRLVLRRKN